MSTGHVSVLVTRLLPLTVVSEQSLSGEEWHTQHVRGLHQQLVLSLLEVLGSQSTVTLLTHTHRAQYTLTLASLEYEIKT